jgi:RNA polymerase sigma-70 factor (ECF subfamily)
LVAAAPLVALGDSPCDATDWSDFSRFCREALPAVYSYLFSRCGRSRSVAEDLTQETFLAAVAIAKAGDGRAVSVPWLIGVARHKLIDHIRRRDRDDRRRRALEQNAVIGGTSDVARELAFATLDELPPSQRAAMVLHYIDGLPVGDVAAVLGKSVHATESLLARGRESFRRNYQKDHDD